MITETDEITALKRTRWRTAISARVERFSQLLDNKNIAAKYFGEKYVEQLSSNISRLLRTQVLLAAAYLVLMLSLFAAQESGKSEFEIFGYGFKNVGYHKEILLLIAASLSPISATVSGYHRYLVALRDQCLNKLAPIADVREFYSSAVIDNYFDALAKPHDYQTSRPHVITKALAVSLVSIMLLMLLAVLAGSFLLQVSVIYDVATHPSTSPTVNLFVVGYAVCALLLSWVISALQLPLPEVDLSNYRRLSDLQKSDPAKYQETMSRLAREATKREDTWSLALGFFLSILTISALSIGLQHDITTNLAEFLARGIGAVFAALLFARPAADFFKKLMLKWFFGRYSDTHPKRLAIYKRVNHAVLATRMVVPAAIAALFLLFQHYRT
jgi:hypothetical protein